ELGVEQRTWSDEDLLSLLNKHAVHYLVVQPGFWNDLNAMRRFETLLANEPQFERVTVFPTPANHPAQETELVIWRNKAASNNRNGRSAIDLPIIGRQIPGQNY